MNKRGFTLIELLVVIAIIGVLAAILLPNIVSALARGEQTADVNNLKSLCNTYTTGLTASKPVPRAKGHRFWLALFVGDQGGIQGGLKIEDAYARPGDASILRCSKDNAVKSQAEISREFEEMLESKRSGWDQLGSDDLYTSYAGPRHTRSFARGEVVGATGARNGNGFFDTGFSMVRGNGSSEFKEYTRLAVELPQEWGNAEDLYEPLWDSTLLKTVLNLDSPEN